MVEKNMNALMRHYVHGDLVEGTIDSYYCTACDAFETEKHFLDEKHIKNRSKQYFASLNRWINWDAISKQRLRRAPVRSIYCNC